MAQTQYISLTPEQEALFFKHLNSGDRLVYGKINRKTRLLSRRRKAGVRARSLLPEIAESWNLLTPTEQEAWKSAGEASNMKGYNAFVKDKSLRIINDIAGNAEPSDLHQALVGYMLLEDPADSLVITQLHPRSYWVSKKVTGKKGMYEPVVVTEDFSLPLKISLSYKSDLVSVGSVTSFYGEAILGDSFFGAGGEPSEPSFYGEAILGDSIFGNEEIFTTGTATFYAEVRSSYQGVDRITYLEIPISLQSDWVYAEATLSNLRGYVIGYSLEFILDGVRGLLLCDNIKAEHSGQNWVRDWQCNDMNQGFTRAYFQVPKHWVAESLPAGADFGSMYPAD